MDFLKNISSEDQGKHGQERGLFDKLGGVLQSQIHPHPPNSPPPTSKHEALLGKIGDVLHHASAPNSTSPQPASTKHDDDLIGKIGKISSALGGEKPGSTPANEGLFGKINSVIGGKQEPAKPHSLGDKINHALGGGAAGEQKEDVLDKAIDLFQEHVLKQGPQNNESAIEQLKDKQIADAIKHQFKSVTGKEFPGTKK